ncbi:dNTP triphosphohydrolase [Rhodobacteraceae bacterium]|nr:dNTP triphosphohydrolase [Paracoccaceae bacterium]
MQWDALLSDDRLCQPKARPTSTRSNFVQDYDRIVFSAPFRRLANKTQVQPLYENDHVHHRLIHSIEVSSVGRNLATIIARWMVEQHHLDAARERDLPDIVQAACVAHDIGNPPFGHSGEAAMGGWFAAGFAQAKTGVLATLDPALRRQFEAFEGNAQGFRILSRLEMYRNDGGMRLSKAVLGAFAKYPVDAQSCGKITETYSGVKKFGLFHSDLGLFESVAQTLGLPKEVDNGGQFWRRHPLVFVVEAADDICYNIVDLEDAFTTGELSFGAVRALLLGDAVGEGPSDESDATQAEQIAHLRALAIGRAVESCAQAFIRNYPAIMDGTFSTSLVESCDMSRQILAMKKTAGTEIFTARRKTELELSGRQIIANILSGVLPVYDDLAAQGWDVDRINDHSRHLVRALGLDLRDITTPETALHALSDFTSGMTDRYALRISRMLSGI